MVKIILFQGLGGLGLFLLGMKMLSEGLQRVAGKRLRSILAAVSNNRCLAFSVGALVTAIIQSSSATTVMLVGFVNAGLMNLTQAAGVVLGANVGTTITAQLIAFNISDYALPAVALGTGLKFFAKEVRWRSLGDVLLGFGLLFYGMSTMKGGFAPIKHDPDFISFFTMFDAENLKGILLCVLVGTVMTVVIQSSSATVGITIALASQGLIGLSGSVALILGDNIGTTVTAQLATIGTTNRNARRVAWVHSFFNVFGAAFIILIFPLFLKLVVYVTSTWLGAEAPGVMHEGLYTSMPRYIANAHTLFNVLNSLVFLALLPVLIRMAMRVVPPKDEAPGHFKYLDFRYVEVPEVALQQAREEIHRMGMEVRKTFMSVTSLLEVLDERELGKWRERERAIDLDQKEVLAFLVRTSQASITPEQSREISSLMRVTNNLERAGDAVQNIAELVEEVIENNIQLSREALDDYAFIRSKAEEILSLVVDSILEYEGDMLQRAKELEDEIDLLREQMRAGHIDRLRRGVCAVDPGLVFTDLLSNLEKVGDYCYNVAQGLAGVK